ncbi:hypothetical protein Cni_G04619 [Canna indica]|uniref:Fe2OG dioxygenase domain-containing protein n=1 Tax=Canna indica TaxID=4628 RepID=A0AAQ3JVR0_9LILI|nr:hypothetical protein Cni_G04619 [Canna indica]
MEGEEERGENRFRIDDYTVGFLPTVAYIPNFVTQSEQSQLLHHNYVYLQIYEVPASRWKSLKNRRLQNWGGVVHEKGLLPQPLPSWLTKITEKISQQTGLFPSPINHVLINEYLPDQGIMSHQDGPAYFPVVAILSLESPITIDFTPHPRSKDKDSTISTESTGSPVDEHHQCSVLLMPCSLLIFKDQAYTDYLHGIQDSEVLSLDKVVNTSEVMKLKDPGFPHSSLQELTSEGKVSTDQNNIFRRNSTRVSLTCRLVLKVHKNLFKF